MKIKTTKSVLLDALKKVQNIVPGKATVQIIQNAQLIAADGKVKITTTDLDMSIISEFTCEVIEPGATTMPIRLFSNVVSKVADGTVEISVDAKERAEVKAGSSSFKISGLPSDQFPKLPDVDNSITVKIPQTILKDMIRKTMYAASKDDTRRTLCSILFSFKDGKLTMVATDGRRLAFCEHEAEFAISLEGDYVIPYKTVSELTRILGTEGDCTISIAKSQILFTTDTLQFYSKLMDETYPNYRQVIPGQLKEQVEIDRQMLVDAIDRVSVFADNNTDCCQIALDFKDGELFISANTADMGEAHDTVPVKYSGEPIKIIFNPFYLLDPLKCNAEDEVTIKLNNGTSPAVITVPDNNFLYVLMPLRQQ